MKKLLLSIVLILLISGGYVLAEIPTEYGPNETSYGNISPRIFIIPLVFGILALISFIFWIWMMVDVIRYQEKDKPLWVLVILLGNLPGAIIYYFVNKRTRNSIITDINTDTKV